MEEPCKMSYEAISMNICGKSRFLNIQTWNKFVLFYSNPFKRTRSYCDLFELIPSYSPSQKECRGTPNKPNNEQTHTISTGLFFLENISDTKIVLGNQSLGLFIHFFLLFYQGNLQLITIFYCPICEIFPTSYLPKAPSQQGKDTFCSVVLHFQSL